MREDDIQAVKAALELKAQSLSDPFEAALRRATRPRRLTPLWFAVPGLAAAAVLFAVISLSDPFAGSSGSSGAWAAVLDDIWVAESDSSDVTGVLDAVSTDSWNLLDLSGDQGI
jgi:hypothetical protein